MGLAASQARLLTITSRKSSAQFESMRLSHQKLALSRNLTDVSNEYQNSLKQTRLYYDFYGNGSTDNLMSYGLFMTPSFINDYTPILVTNQQNRVVLSTVFAEAARAAGIPQEGLNGYIDNDTRNKFIRMLKGFNEIDEPTANLITGDNIAGVGIPYNPNVGLGYTTGLAVTYTTEDYSNFNNRLADVCLSDYAGLTVADLNAATLSGDNIRTGIMACTLTSCADDDITSMGGHEFYNDNYNFSYKNEISGSNIAPYHNENNDPITPDGTYYGGGEAIPDSYIHRLSDTTSFNFKKGGTEESFATSDKTWSQLTLSDILYGDDIILTQNVQQGKDITNALDVSQYNDMLNVVDTVINLLKDKLEQFYGVDTDVAMAIQQADVLMNASCWNNRTAEELAVTTPGNEVINTERFETNGNWSYLTQYYNQVIALRESASELQNFQNSNGQSLNLIIPHYSAWSGGFAEEFITAEDAGDLSYYNNTGAEPASYWVSMPSTLAGGSTMYYQGVVKLDANGNLQPDPDYNNYNESNGNDNVHDGAVATGMRNAMVNALYGAQLNMALINLYDNTGEQTPNHEHNDNKYVGGNIGAINLSAFVKAWYTYFIDSVAQSKLASVDDLDSEEYSEADKERMRNQLTELIQGTRVSFRASSGYSDFATEGDMVDNLNGIVFNHGEVVVDDGINDIATFYDTIINQICEYGWTENNEVKEDPMYLQEMIKSGKMFLFKMANDNFYYQKNYSTDTFIKEIEDETAIAQAEAKYKTQKSRINAKEQEIDIKMKNLDTEISSLETEYEAVKKMISNNAQKAFARYQS